MPTQHVVTQGECLVSIAHQYGVSWRTLWDHGGNAELKSKRKNPNVLYPGDVLEIPDRPLKDAKVATDAKHKFVVKRPKTKVRVNLKDAEGNAPEGKRYVLKVGDLEIEGTVPGDGLIEAEVPANATDGTLTLHFDPEEEEGGDDEESGPPAPAFHRIALRIGHLDPIDTDEGVAARLSNLGFSDVHAFQTKHGLDATGQVDDATRQKLEELHLC